MILLSQAFATPGAHQLFLPGAVGTLEVELNIPAQPPKYLAVLGHPHSLHGGTMHNKVVTTLVRMFRELSIPSLRFNFRGVGCSQGEYHAGIGESEDMILLTRQCLDISPQLRLIFAGFSFGSYVAYRAAAQMSHDLLITIAPSVENFNYTEFLPSPTRWIVAQGENDEVVSAEQVFAFAHLIKPPVKLLHFAETGHFFHGKLVLLKERLIETVREYLGEPAG